MSKSKYEFHRNLAIIIGINDYSNEIRPLETAVPDAEEFARIMKEQYQYEVHLLLNQDATLDKLKNLIECFNKQQIPFGKDPDINDTDRILIYFAGHGIAFDAKDNQEGPVGYLIPQDATDNPNTYLPMQEFHDALLKLPCRHLLVILDCCFSGAFYWSSINRDVVPKVKLYKQVYDHYIKYRAWQVITSTSDKQTAVDSSPRGQVSVNSKVHSPFAKHLFDALNKSADLDNDGIITANDLFNFLRKAVAVETEEYKAQTPGICPLKLHDNGEYLFLLQSEPNLEDAPPLDLEKSPYRGLESYEEEHEDLYFGRKEQIEQLYKTVINSNNRSLTVVLGASGTGKSSLVKAGLIPLLRKQKLEANYSLQKWEILKPIRLGESPLTALKNSLSQELSFTSSNPNPDPTQTDDLKWFSKFFNWLGIGNQPNRAKQNQQLEQEVELLSQNLKNWFNNNPDRTLVMTIDQFEELITLQPRQDQKEEKKKPKENKKKEEKQKQKTQQELVLKWLPEVMSKYGDRLQIILTLRSDFESQFQDGTLNKYWTEEARFHIKEMTTAELREAITEPASKKSIFFVPNTLVDKLVDEVAGMPGTLPLLSFTLNELYRIFVEDVNNGDKDDRAITEEYYQQLGGVARSLTQKAEQEYEYLVNQDKAYEQTIRRVMLRMVAIGGGELARRRVLKSELKYPEPENTRVWEVVKTFVKARLLVEGKNTQNEPYVEPAHDALVRGWERLLKWKQEEEENLILQRQLTPAAVEWKTEQSESKGYLWHNNPRLDLLKKELKSKENWFNELETEFVQCSIGHKNFMTNVARLLTGTVIVGLSGLTLWALIEQRKTVIGQMRTLTQSSESDLRSNSLTLDALVNSLKAAKLTKHWLLFFSPDEVSKNEVTRTLRKAFYTVKEDNRWSIPLDWKIHDISVSTDGKTLVAITKDKDTGTILCIWSINDEFCDENHQIFVKSADSSPEGIKFSLDGQRLVITSQESEGKITVHLWDWINNKTKELPPGSIQGNFTKFSFHPKKQELAIVDAQIPYLWNLDSNQVFPLPILPSNLNKVVGIQFDSNGNLLLATTTDPEKKDDTTTPTVDLWSYDRTAYKKLGTLAVPNAVDTALISPDSQRVVIIYGSATRFGAGSLLWTLGQNQQRNEWESLGQDLTVNFSQDGQQLVTSGSSGTIKLRDWSGSNKVDLNGHQGLLRKITFSQDGRLLLTAGSDGTIRLWNMEERPLTLIKDSQNLSSDGDQALAVEVENNKCKLDKVSQSKDSKIFGFYIDESDPNPDTVDVWNCSLNKLLDSVSVGKIYLKEWQALALGSDANLIAIATSPIEESDVNLVGLWDFQDTKLAEYKSKLDKISSLSISPDGSIITIFGENKDKKEIVQVGGLDELFAKGCDRIRDYLQNNPNVPESDRQLCDRVPLDPSINATATQTFLDSNQQSEIEVSISDKISAGDKILVPVQTPNHPDKQAGIDAIAAGDFKQAVTSLKAYLNPKKNPNDPEAQIYLNNAQIGNQKSYTIAVSVPISSNINGSLEILRGVAQAQDDFNNWAKTQQGILPIRVLIADDHNDPKVAQEIAKEFANNPDVLGVVGHYASDVTLAAGEIYQSQKLVAISPISTSVNLSKVLGEYVFRTVPSDKIAAIELANYIAEQLEKKKAVVFYNHENDYSRSMKSEFESALASQGGQVLKPINLSDPNFNADQVVEDFIQKGAEVLVLMPNTEKLNEAIKVIEANNQRLPLLAGDGMYNPNILEKVGQQAVNMVVAIPWHIKAHPESNFSRKSKALWGDRDVNWRTAMSYDAAKALMAAIKEKNTRQEIAQFIGSEEFKAQGSIESVQFLSGDRKENIIQLVKIVKPEQKSSSGYDYEFKPVENNSKSKSETQAKPSK
ncbi:hypothetical protein PL8927_600002 [Planktothrix serta PCC 8927]|uniref:Extracellular ligand-binding receptor n=1 Tax=Planktothrix serta PCC 8927 TaxID=671068 RepID=A0A7Z9DXW2_9CYAN|nr:ABC transporter substrate-binding protein [Planktothrix serta]VXD17528.1 hypothetical protein PL8927_600002 [Planktothrix serta PCC 8927]